MRPSDNDINLSIAKTLEHSLGQIDADTALQLQHARKLALAQTIKKRWSAAIAAGSIAAAVILSWSLVFQPIHQDTELQASTTHVYLQEDPQIVANWEMLLAIGEAPDA